MNEYRFSNLGLSGRIELKDGSVHWCCKYFWHGKYEREIPLNKLQPEYLRTVGPMNNLGTLIGITSLGLLVAIGLLRDRVPNIPSTITASLIATTAIATLAIYMSYRKEEWLYFYSTDPHSYFCYCRRGPDSVNFESFTAIIREAIRRQANELG